MALCSVVAEAVIAADAATDQRNERQEQNDDQNCYDPHEDAQTAAVIAV